MEEHPQARFIVETLAKAGFVAYYAGGWVRDFLLRSESDDIDIATNAPPETIQALFPHTVPIGIAFGIILVIVEDHPYEVATFREDFDYQDGRRPSKIAFSTAEEDAKRRDFTINGMFYDPLRGEVLDFVGGKIDLEKKIIRAIGDPLERIKEDRLRMIRAVRLSCRFGFLIEEKTKEAILKDASHIRPAVAIERICAEFIKGKAFGKLYPMLVQLHEFGLLKAIFPSLSSVDVPTVKKNLDPILTYPKEAPLIAYLLPLFPHFSLNEKLLLSKELKLSRKEEQFVQLEEAGWQLIKKEAKPIEWVKFYANPDSPLVTQIIAAHLSDEKKDTFLISQKNQRQRWEFFIQRITTKTPLVTSEHLKKEGVMPGKKMGELLELAEEISVNEEIQDPLAVISRLKLLGKFPPL